MAKSGWIPVRGQNRRIGTKEVVLVGCGNCGHQYAAPGSLLERYRQGESLGGRMQRAGTSMASLGMARGPHNELANVGDALRCAACGSIAPMVFIQGSARQVKRQRKAEHKQQETAQKAKSKPKKRKQKFDPTSAAITAVAAAWVILAVVAGIAVAFGLEARWSFSLAAMAAFPLAYTMLVDDDTERPTTRQHRTSVVRAALLESIIALGIIGYNLVNAYVL